MKLKKITTNKTRTNTIIYSIMKRLFLSCILSINLAVYGQSQIGGNIDGEADFDFSGWSVSMPDASTVAIGAISNDGNGDGSGHTRIYEWDGSAWLQKGADIDGEVSGDESGRSVTMPDPNTVAIGARLNKDNGFRAGHTRIYKWDGSSWVQKGNDIDGMQFEDSGWAVDMPDPNTVAIGAPTANGINDNFDTGRVRIYMWDGNTWLQKGVDIIGESSFDGSGYSVSMPDSNVVAIGARGDDDNGDEAGHVRIYEWDGNAWTQKGMDIDGEASGDFSGRAVSMPDASTVAIGAISNDGNGDGSGHTRIYEWNGSAWIQKGQDIDGKYEGDASGFSVSMANSDVVAFGAPGYREISDATDQVRIYIWNGNGWIQLGTDIDGDAVDVNFGHAVSMPNINTVAIGATGANIIAGYVQVYNLSSLNIDNNKIKNSVDIYPNPTLGKINVQMDDTQSDKLEIKLSNIKGQVVFRQTRDFLTNFSLDVNGSSGIYFLEIKTDDDKRFVQRIVKK